MDKNYFPDPVGSADCGQCEWQGCPNRHKFQRHRWDLTVTSGRCPRLTDQDGRIDEDWLDEFKKAVPVAEVILDSIKGLQLRLSVPDKNRMYRISWGKPGRRLQAFWYINQKSDLGTRRVIYVGKTLSRYALFEKMKYTTPGVPVYFRAYLTDEYL